MIQTIACRHPLHVGQARFDFYLHIATNNREVFNGHTY